MVYDIGQFPENKPVWAFAYLVNDDTNTCQLYCPPTFGEVQNVKGKMFPQFCKYKKDGSLSASYVNAYSRRYADTYEEAVDTYNGLIQTRIDKLIRMVEEAKRLKR